VFNLIIAAKNSTGIFHVKGAMWLAGGPVRGRKGATDVAVPRNAAGVLEDGTPAAPDPAVFAAGARPKKLPNEPKRQAKEIVIKQQHNKGQPYPLLYFVYLCTRIWIICFRSLVNTLYGLRYTLPLYSE